MAQTQSSACCTVEPIASGPYDIKGSYTELDGLKTYISGSTSSKKGILFVYDIFGMDHSSTLQGADILGAADYLVAMPDFFKGETAQLSWYPTDTEEKKNALGQWFQSKAQPAATLKQLETLVPALKQQYPSVESWYALGYCWGGKIVTLQSAEGTPFKATVQTSPGMFDPADAEKVTIPMAVLASKGEDAEKVKAFDAALKVPKHVETFSDQVHGWMSARADLSDARVREEYRRGYQIVIDWFGKYA